VKTGCRPLYLSVHSNSPLHALVGTQENRTINCVVNMFPHQFGAVLVLVDGPMRRWDKWWNEGDWIHRELPADEHIAVPMRDVGA